MSDPTLREAARDAIEQLDRLTAIIEGRDPVAHLQPPHGQTSARPRAVADRLRAALDAPVRAASSSLDREGLADLMRRIEKHVDFECGADHRYAFMEEVRVLFGALVPVQPPVADLDVERLARAILTTLDDAYAVTVDTAEKVAREYARLTAIPALDTEKRSCSCGADHTATEYEVIEWAHAPVSPK